MEHVAGAGAKVAHVRPHRIRRMEEGGEDVPSFIPKLLLVCEASSTNIADGRWRFVIEKADGVPVLEASDEEPGDLNRLTLLAAVRGLEAIDGPASVTLLSNSRYLISSLVDALPRWRQRDFAWEHFGRVIDVQHADLWRRIDRALQFHRVQACLVSSRLVSPGHTSPSEVPESSAAAHSSGSAGLRGDDQPADERWSRIDAGHPQPPRPAAVEPTEDPLRRWLLGGRGAAATPIRKRRFTSADLAGSP